MHHHPDNQPPAIPIEEAVEEALLRAGAKPRYVRRLVGELRDHRLELEHREEDQASSGVLADVGHADVIVRAALLDPRTRRLARRKPLVVFALFPALALPLALVALAVSLAGGIELAEWLLQTDLSAPQFFSLHRMLETVVKTTDTLLPGVLALGFFRWMARAGADARWALLAGAILVASALLHSLTFDVQTALGEASLELHSGTERLMSRLATAGLAASVLLGSFIVQVQRVALRR